MDGVAGVFLCGGGMAVCQTAEARRSAAGGALKDQSIPDRTESQT
jgi:hypothetical protein